jgi:PHS family inorganic phosphate transporter-like MFS transporter
VRACVVAGIGFFTDSYDIFTAGLLTTMLGIVYWKAGKMPTNSDTAIKVATSGGTVVGQLGFGALADIVGRKKMYGLELIIIIFATLAQALSSSSKSMDIVGVIIFWRVIMGIGRSLETIGSAWMATNKVQELAETILSHRLLPPNSLLQNGEEP